MAIQAYRDMVKMADSERTKRAKLVKIVRFLIRALRLSFDLLPRGHCNAYVGSSRIGEGII